MLSLITLRPFLSVRGGKSKFTRTWVRRGLYRIRINLKWGTKKRIPYGPILYTFRKSSRFTMQLRVRQYIYSLFRAGKASGGKESFSPSIKFCIQYPKSKTCRNCYTCWNFGEFWSVLLYSYFCVILRGKLFEETLNSFKYKQDDNC